jgi:hypothetical protein
MELSTRESVGLFISTNTEKCCIAQNNTTQGQPIATRKSNQ